MVTHGRQQASFIWGDESSLGALGVYLKCTKLHDATEEIDLRIYRICPAVIFRLWAKQLDLLNADQTNAEAYDYRAHTKVKLDDYVGAIDDYTKSLELFPNDPIIYSERASTYVLINQISEACADISLALNLGIEVQELPKDYITLCEESD